MVSIIFLRHGESTANVDGVLAGRRPGVELTAAGVGQISSLARTLPHVERVYHSTVHRCVKTTELVLEHAGFDLDTEAVIACELFDEVDYGHWSGTKLSELKSLPDWSIVRKEPSAISFPGGESLANAAQRAITGVEKVCAEVDSGTVLVVSHGDIIKAVLAHALGMPLDEFQRIAVAPGSASIVDYEPGSHPVVKGMSITTGLFTDHISDLGGGR